ncbi:hypothetical protein O6H91_23G016700 [Diphasiastrum complanatum]|uniref:Uncharacterized protein n=1 Tax=Diphasiastrum complanatum TaxID=34168 RepID=A0ACC2A8J9_DIPCM|nr:hypothetical protein O6H91_23G016700 [Diphasiastrum complanatum]
MVLPPQLLLESFLRGLSSNIHLVVRQSRVSSLEEAISRATIVEEAHITTCECQAMKNLMLDSSQQTLGHELPRMRELHHTGLPHDTYERTGLSKFFEAECVEEERVPSSIELLPKFVEDYKRDTGE